MAEICAIIDRSSARGPHLDHSWIQKRRQVGVALTATPEIRAPVEGRGAEILSPEALALVARLHEELDGERRQLLARRAGGQAELDAGALPDFLTDTREVREADWQVAPAPPALENRRVEITGPVDRKMMINALNSGATGFMADF